MKKRLRKALGIILAMICLLATGQVIRLVLDGREAKQATSHAQDLAGAIPEGSDSSTAETDSSGTTEGTLPQDENVSYLQQLDILALRAVNADVIGWIYIPGADINHPLMQTTDNSTYLYTNWEGNYNADGSIFLETECSSDLKDFNTIIYGHNMLSGSMFAPLHRYRDYNYYREHPYVYIVTDSAIYRYEIFSAYKAGVKTDTYRLQFTDDEKKQALGHYVTSSLWAGNLIPTPEDFILTLSTCTGTGRYENRWVVQAALDEKLDK